MSDIVDLVKAAGKEDEVDLVAGGNTTAWLSDEEASQGMSDYEAAKKAGADLSEVQLLSKEEMLAVRVTALVRVFRTYSFRVLDRNTVQHSPVRISPATTSGPSSSSPFSTTRPPLPQPLRSLYTPTPPSPLSHLYLPNLSSRARRLDGACRPRVAPFGARTSSTPPTHTRAISYHTSRARPGSSQRARRSLRSVRWPPLLPSPPLHGAEIMGSSTGSPARPRPVTGQTRRHS